MWGHSGTGVSTPSWRRKLPQTDRAQGQELLAKGVPRTGLPPG